MLQQTVDQFFGKLATPQDWFFATPLSMSETFRKLVARKSGDALVINSSARVVPEHLPPSLYSYSCLQCDISFTAVIYCAPEGKPALAIFPLVPGGVSTPHTPEAVGYYLDQAFKSHSVGANSAATAMYRAALEPCFSSGVLTRGC